MARRRRRRRARRASGTGRFCMMLRKGRGKRRKIVTRCYLTSSAMERALSNVYAGPKVYNSILLYKRVRK